MSKTTTTRRVKELLASCPKAGTGVHPWLFRTALKLHKHFPDKAELERRLAEATAGCGRGLSESEIGDAVRNSQLFLEGQRGQTRAVRRWPKRNESLVETIVRGGPNYEQLRDLSPVKWQDDARHTEEIIDVLFPGNPLLCAGPRMEFSLTRHRGDWRGLLEKQQLIVPNPMAATHGRTQSGKRSSRTLANTGPRRFLVVEFDQNTRDQQAALAVHLAKIAPLVMVVYSGGKSLHSWFYAAGKPEKTVEKFFEYAVSLGADPAIWTRCQLVRMPDAQRDNGKRQEVVFFNPKPLEVK